MPATLIYDGDCPLCLKAASWVRANASVETIDLITCQSEARTERFPQVAETECMQAMQLVMPNGVVYSGDEALPVLLSMLRRWRWLARVFRVPGVTLLAPHAYRFIARNRHVFSVFVAHKVIPCDEKCAPED